jgi:maltose alpha-D-glucosyltransferase/alpha-amylase
VAALQYLVPGRERATVGAIHELIAHEGTGWDLTLTALERFFEQVLTIPVGGSAPVARVPDGAVSQRARQIPDEETKRLIGTYLEQARQLGVRVAKLHQQLASDRETPAFAPEPFHTMHQHSIYQGARQLLVRTFQLLRKHVATVPEDARALAEQVLAREAEVERRFNEVTRRKIDVERIRNHGDLHLGQVLFLGDDFLVFDFEGEPARRLHERRYKRVGLRDATSMLRSFAYAAESALRLGATRDHDVAGLDPWAHAWVEWVSAAFLGGYYTVLDGTRLVPKTDRERDLLVDFYTLEKCIYEIGYELQNRPTWLAIPLRGLLRLLDEPPHGA